MNDKNGRTYATVADTKIGDILQVDGDFTCMEPNGRRIVFALTTGELYVTCGDGKHFLDGQKSEDGTHYVGLYPVAKEEAK